MDPLNTCVLCLLQNKIIKNISSPDDDNIVIEQKVKFVLPEKNITSSYNKIINYQPHLPKHICIDCLGDLNHVYNFKLKCMKNIESLSESIGKTSYNTESSDTSINDLTTDHHQNFTVVVKSEPREIQDSAAGFEQIVVKEEHEDLNEEIDLKDDPLFAGNTYGTSQNGSTSNEVQMVISDSESIPSDIDVSTVPVLPEKSREAYEHTYSKLEDWCTIKGIKNCCDEKVLLVYFEDLAKLRKPSSLWAYYSMLRTVMSVKQNVDISKFTNLIAFLKKQSEGYRPKKTKVLRFDEISRFLLEADDKHYLLIKVALIIGVVGACRREELTNLQIKNVKNEGQCIHVIIPKTRTKKSREFFVTRGNIPGVNMVETVRQYLSMRPVNTEHSRFFTAYRNGKCVKQPVGINAFGKMPRTIATFLNLPNSQQYTGHCFRKSSVSLHDTGGAKRQGSSYKYYVPPSSTGSRSHKCTECPKSFKRPWQLTLHLRIHTGEKPFKCDACDSAFSRSSSLIKHKYTHSGERPYVCDVCNKTFSTTTYLTIHKRTHSDEKPFKCEFCGKGFRQTATLIRHKHTHTGNKPHVCDVCNKAFNQAIHLAQHKRTHTGERPYVCEVCNTAFNQSATLMRHKFIHTGEKQHKCDICDKAFSRPDQLGSHKKFMH